MTACGMNMQASEYSEKDNMFVSKRLPKPTLHRRLLDAIHCMQDHAANEMHHQYDETASQPDLPAASYFPCSCIGLVGIHFIHC